jgi:O-antigen/teichoic acid export membrane protein
LSAAAPSNGNGHPKEIELLFERIGRARDYLFSEGLGPFLVRSVAGTGVVQLCGMALGFLVGVQLARGLGPTPYGQYGIAMAAVTILSVPGQFGLPRLVLREVAAALPSGNVGRIRGITSWASRFSWWISAVVAVLTAICAFAYSLGAQGEVAKALLVGAILIPLMTLTRVTGGALQGLHWPVLGQLPDGVVRPLVCSIALFLLFALVDRPTASDAMAVGAIAAGCSFLMARRLLAWKLPQGETERGVGDVRKWIGSAIPLALTSGIRTLEGQLGVLFLGFLATEAEAGYFRLAMSIAVLLSMPITLVSNSVIPVFARLFAAGDRPKLQRVVTHAGRAQFGGVLLVSLPLFLAAKPLISLLFGARYAVAAGPVVLIAVAQLISTAFGPNGHLLNMTRHERRVNVIVLISVAVNAATSAALIPIFGLTGAAWGWIVATFVWNLLAWHWARKHVGVDTFIVPMFAKRTR